MSRFALLFIFSTCSLQAFAESPKEASNASSVADSESENLAPEDPLNAALAALWEVAACGEPLTKEDRSDALLQLLAQSSKTIDAHCKALKEILAPYKKDWLTPASAFFEAHVPKHLPPHIVYPFSGADLLTALVVFPNFQDLTSASLESGGDPRGIFRANDKELKNNLQKIREYMKKLVTWNHSRTLDLQSLEAFPLPSQLVFALIGLQVHGLQPTQLRAIALEKDGSFRTLGPKDYADMDQKAGKRSGSRKNRRLHQAFSSYELQFQHPDSQEISTYRHFAANMADKELEKNPGILNYFKSLGPVAAMTKAASHLLWHAPFSSIRNYLKDNMQWMVSDSTGINPMHLDPKKWKQEVFGKFKRAEFNPTRSGENALRALYESRPYQPLPFKYFGYPSKELTSVLIITEPIQSMESDKESGESQEAPSQD